MKLKCRYLTLMVLLLVSMVTVIACNNKSTGETKTGNQVKTKKKTGLEFPYELENGKIRVNSLFQSSISNPDCEDKEGEDIASLEITNSSEEFLKKAQIEVKLDDGTVIPFSISNIPAGKTVCAFATDNTSIELDVVCSEIESNVEFQEKKDLLMKDSINIETDGTRVTLENKTDESFSDVSVYCHCLLNDVYFGGVSYKQVIDIPASGSAVFNADDCYLGSAEVVCVQKK